MLKNLHKKSPKKLQNELGKQLNCNNFGADGTDLNRTVRAILFCVFMAQGVRYSGISTDRVAMFFHSSPVGLLVAPSSNRRAGGTWAMIF